MIAILDRQHFGKPGRRRDLGAGYDLDGDGLVGDHEREASLTPYYIEAARKHVEAAGHGVIVEDRGWYSKRHIRANIFAAEARGPVAYVACHINAGGGDYAAIIHDARSQNGKRLADLVAESLNDLHLAGVSRVIVRGATPDNDWSRGLNTIKGIWSGPANICGICFEPLFIDCHAHRQWLNPVGLDSIGAALGSGLIEWALGDINA